MSKENCRVRFGSFSWIDLMFPDIVQRKIMRAPISRVAALLLLTLLGMNMLFAAAPGGFSDVGVDDAGVKAAADFAIQERAKTEPGIKLDKITKASRQVVAGLNYDLTLSVTVGKEQKSAKVRVWAKLDRTHEVTSWEYLKN